MAREFRTLVLMLLVAALPPIYAQDPPHASDQNSGTQDQQSTPQKGQGGRMGRFQRQGQQGQQGQGAGRGMMMRIIPTLANVNGTPALKFTNDEGWSVYVLSLTRQGEPALGFPVMMDGCGGALFVTRTRLAGDFSKAAQKNPNCQSFDFPRTDVTAQREQREVVLTTSTGNYALKALGEKDGQYKPIGPVAMELLVRSVTNFDQANGFVRRTIHGLQQQASKQNQPAQPAGGTRTSAAAVTLTINSTPGDVQVYLNDQPMGLTSEEGNLVLPVAPGDYKLRLDLPGYKEFQQPVTVAAGKPSSIDAKLETVGPPPFTSADIRDMLQGKVSPKRIQTLVQERGVDFQLTDELEKDFKSLGATSDLLLEIATSKK